jgi:hypothetical protein
MIPDNPDDGRGPSLSRLPLPSRRDAILIGSLIVAVAAVLAFACIGCKSFWLDEATSYWRAREPWGPFWDSALRRDPSMPLYYLLLRAWVNIGSSEAILRSLSALFAIGTVVLGYHVASTFFGRLTGLVAAALLGTNAFLIEYAQEARGYVPSAFLVLLSIFLLSHAIQNRTVGSWITWGIVLAAAIGTHPFALLAGAGQIVSLVAVPLRGRDPKTPRSKESRRAHLIFVVLALVAAGGLAVVLAPNVVRALSGGLVFLPDPSLALLLNSLGSLTGYGVFLLVIPAAIVAVAFVNGVQQFKERGRSWEAWRYAVLASAFVVPIVIAFAFSYITPAFSSRYMIAAVPPMCILIAAGITRMAKPWLFWVALVVALVLPTGSINAWFDSNKEDWRGLTGYVLGNVEEGDVLFLYGPTGGRAFAYYAEQMDADTIPPFAYPTMRWVQTDGRQAPLPPPLTALTRTARLRDRVWLVLSLDATNLPGPVPILRALNRTHERKSIRRFVGTSAILFERTQEPKDRERRSRS